MESQILRRKILEVHSVGYSCAAISVQPASLRVHGRAHRLVSAWVGLDGPGNSRVAGSLRADDGSACGWARPDRGAGRRRAGASRCSRRRAGSGRRGLQLSARAEAWVGRGQGGRWGAAAPAGALASTRRHPSDRPLLARPAACLGAPGRHRPNQRARRRGTGPLGRPWPACSVIRRGLRGRSSRRPSGAGGTVVRVEQ